MIEEGQRLERRRCAREEATEIFDESEELMLLRIIPKTFRLFN